MEKVNLRKALELATGALAFYANPEVYQYRGANPPITPAAIIDGGLLARMTLAVLVMHLDDDAQYELRRCLRMAGEDD